MNCVILEHLIYNTVIIPEKDLLQGDMFLTNGTSVWENPDYKWYNNDTYLQSYSVGNARSNIEFGKSSEPITITGIYYFITK